MRTVLDGHQLPFANACLRAIAMTDVLHHLPKPREFFREAARTLRPGGVIAMIEPWVTPWSTFIYTKLHHEPFRLNADQWEFPATGPLSGANGALPWIIFHRDRQQFESEFPEFQIEIIRPIMPFRYLLSGGVSLRGLTPAWTFHLWSEIEEALDDQRDRLAMFAIICLRRRN